MLGIPPHRTPAAFGMHDDRRVGSVRNRLAMGIEQELTGQQIPSMPTVDNQGGRSWAEVVDVPVQQIELVDEFVPGNLQ